MYVNYSGWSKDYGSFSCNIFIDETRQDYEIHYGNGTIAKQCSPFECRTADWNHDGDVYTQFGAWFRTSDQSGADFWSPEQMVGALVEAQYRERSAYGNEVVAIPGVEIPPRDRRPKLEDTIRQSERRAMHQEIERNRKMAYLGIRPPNEPWAR